MFGVLRRTADVFKRVGNGNDLRANDGRVFGAIGTGTENQKWELGILGPRFAF